ncbi:MAG: hypothetical protein RMN51_06210 [Verrucomicrobiota bacterium]|nr:hypothetical protein [Limisphaera sp.]MDW8381684.1 hypothetical protein [Verrucomicrobiota bacterium]
MHSLWVTFTELLVTPFRHGELIWGIVPLYFALVLNETTPAKADFRTAVQTGFSFLWSAAHWTYPSLKDLGDSPWPMAPWDRLPTINVCVTLAVACLGVLALAGGLRRRFFRGTRFLGHSRFANYFMIAIFPIQSGHLPWTWERVAAVAVFAAPVWIILHIGLMPLRR